MNEEEEEHVVVYSTGTNFPRTPPLPGNTIKMNGSHSEPRGGGTLSHWKWASARLPGGCTLMSSTLNQE